MTVNILGTEYQIIKKTYTEDDVFERRSIDGYCDALQKKIVYCDLTTYKGWEHEEAETIRLAEKHAIRHEIVHAFFAESGLADCTYSVKTAWATNEEMVDWIASQGAKIYAAWHAARVA